MVPPEVLTDLLAEPGAGTHLAVATVSRGGAEVVSAVASHVCNSDLVLFDLASLTKLYTATRVLELVGVRALDLDAPASSYLQGDIASIAQSSIADLLEFRGGFPPHVELREIEPYRSDPQAAFALGRGAVLRQLAHLAARARLPDQSERVYNNVSYIILGEVLASFEPWSHINDDFKRRGLRQTCYTPLSDGWTPDDIAPTEDDSWRGRRSHGDVHDETAYLLGGTAGHAGVFATCSDVAEFTRRWLSNDALLGISPELHAASLIRRDLEIFRRPSEMDPADVEAVPDTAVGMSGFTGTSVWLEQSQDIACVVLSNRVYSGRRSGWIRRVRSSIHQRVFGAR